MRRSPVVRRFLVSIVLVGFAAGVVTAAVWPARRLVGVNFVVTEQTLPLWIKTIDFVDRDLNLARVAHAVLGDVIGDEARAMTALQWVPHNIHGQPPGLPVVDDHVWHVIVRGYGTPDQKADVFATLLAYEGVPAYWQLIGQPPNELPLSYVLIDGRWRVFDVANGLAFRASSGMLAAPDDLVADPMLVRAAAEGRVSELDAYTEYFRGFRAPRAPDVLRADLQMSGRRLGYELKKLVGRQGRVWQIRSMGQ